jgi:hypothetical protein
LSSLFLASQTLQTRWFATSGRQPHRQSKRQWLDIEVTGWPAGRAFDLEEFAVPCEVADRHWLAPERLKLATASGSVPIALELSLFEVVTGIKVDPMAIAREECLGRA